MEPINLSGPNLTNAQEIKSRAEAKMAHELDAYLVSIDALEDGLKEAYWKLRMRVGKQRADEYAVDLVRLAF